jgi:cytochrome c oxidase subunit IV
MITRVPLIWFVLILLTIGSYVLTEQSSLPWVTAIILGFVAIKGYLIVDGFMELYGHQRLLRYAMTLYCPLLSLLIWIILK